MLIAFHGQFDRNLRAELSAIQSSIAFTNYSDLQDHGTSGQVGILITRSGLKVDAGVLDRLPALQLIVKAGSGTDNIALQDASARGVRVLATGGSERAVAELALALMLACLRHISIHDRALRRGSWDSKARYVGGLLLGKRLGIVGYGRIGQELTQLAHQLGMAVSVYDRSLERREKREAMRKAGAIGCATTSELAQNCDIISLHLPLASSASPPLIDKSFLERMPRGGILINTARAQHVERAALLEALRSGQLAAAGLDVHFDEGGAGDAELIGMDNVVSLPHVGAQTRETHQEMARRIAVVVSAHLHARRQGI
jgi:phosphoglycerate dehydrogenase-like enzyme